MVQANLDVNVFEERSALAIFLIFDNFIHLKGDQDSFGSLFDDIIIRSRKQRFISSKAHGTIIITQCVQLVDTMVLTKLIKLAVDTIYQRKHFLRHDFGTEL